jgi:hypothetical protein
MDGGKDIPRVPARPDESLEAPRIGVDEWVASHEGRSERDAGWTGRVGAEIARVPRPAFYLGFGVVAAFLPLVTNNDYIVRVGFDTLLYMLLALGLNSSSATQACSISATSPSTASGRTATRCSPRRSSGCTGTRS